MDYGYDMAFRNIPRALWNYVYSKQNQNINWPNPNNIEIKLNETKDRELILLTHLLRKDENAFNWLEQNSQASILNALIKTAKNLDIQVSKSFNEQ